MRVNVNHPSFISFLDNVTNTILNSTPIDSYFKLKSENKIALQFAVLKIMKNSIKSRVKLTDMELKSFIVVLQKKNEESENYEFASILNDMSTNFETINQISTAPKRTSRKIKIDNDVK
jgi:hypothetical protein